MRGIDTLEQLAEVKQVVVEAVPRDGFAVLNADDELVRGMRRRCSGEVVWFSMADAGSEIMRDGRRPLPSRRPRRASSSAASSAR